MATEKQKLALSIFLENPGISLGESMRQAGYAEASAKNPQELRGSKAWLELMNKAITDEELVEKHHELLSANRIEHMVFPLGMDEADIKTLLNSVGCVPQKVKHGEQAIHVWYWSPDNLTRGKAIELAYKLKGRLTQRVEVTDPSGLFGSNALTIKVIDGRADAESEAATGA
jgi:hypothetical protein